MARTKRSAKLDTRNARIKLTGEQYHHEPLANGRYLLYRKPKSGAAGSWSACFVNPDTKKQTRITLGTADDFQDADGCTVLSFAQAQAKAVDWFKAKSRQAILQSQGEILPEGDFTVADAMDAYYKASQRNGLKTAETTRFSVNAWIIPTLGNIPVSKLTRIKIEIWLDQIANTPKKVRNKTGCEKAYSTKPMTEEAKRARKSTANRILAVLKSALTQAVNLRLVDAPERPWQLIKNYTGVAKSRVRFLSEKEQVRLVKYCPPGFKELVLGALFTGCRHGELARLRKKDFDKKNGTIFLEHTKTGKPRHIYLTDEGVSFFIRQTADKDPGSLVFTNSRKKWRRKEHEPGVWTPNDGRKYLIRACELAGIDVLTFHELRHTYASMLLNRGVPLVYIANQLGHSNTSMVERYYGHIAPSAVAQAIRRAIPRLGLLETEKSYTCF